jgi:hypothetical protein
MAVWFARQTANINAANVWNAASDGSGAWLTWPPAAGDILMCNSFTLTVNVDVLLGPTGELRNDNANGATAGGYFAVGSTRTITGNVYAGSTGIRCLQGVNSSSNITLTGNAYGGTATNVYGVNLSAGTLTMVGNAYGGTATGAAGVYCTAGTFVFTGNGYGDATGAATGIQLSGTLTTVTITGDMYGGGVTNAFGLGMSSGTPTINMTGNAYGGTVAPGVSNAAVQQTFNLTGNAIAGTGSAAFGVTNAAAGVVSVSGYAQATNTVSAVSNSGQGVVTIGETRSASNGRGAVVGAFRYASATAAKSMPYTVSEGQIGMTVLDVAAIVPAESDVRLSVVYGDGTYTGTYIPPPAKKTNMSRAF